MNAAMLLLVTCSIFVGVLGELDSETSVSNSDSSKNFLSAEENSPIIIVISDATQALEEGIRIDSNEEGCINVSIGSPPIESDSNDIDLTNEGQDSSDDPNLDIEEEEEENTGNSSSFDEDNTDNPLQTTIGGTDSEENEIETSSKQSNEVDPSQADNVQSDSQTNNDTSETNNQNTENTIKEDLWNCDSDQVDNIKDLISEAQMKDEQNSQFYADMEEINFI